MQVYSKSDSVLCQQEIARLALPKTSFPIEQTRILIWCKDEITKGFIYKPSITRALINVGLLRQDKVAFGGGDGSEVSKAIIWAHLPCC